MLIWNVERVKKAILRRLPNVIKNSDRGTTKQVRYKANKIIKKQFNSTLEARQCFQNEIKVRKIFEGYDWVSPIVCSNEYWIGMPLYPDKWRLDKIASTFDEDTGRKVAVQACNIILDMLSKGYAHRDYHSKNLFWVDQSQLVLIDFESIFHYNSSQRPHFYDCYDITGKGLDSPFLTENMCYVSNSPSSLEQVLEIPLDEVVLLLEQDLKNQMREASLAFHNAVERHTCRLGRIYGSFTLPYLSVSKDEAQRDSEIRFTDFGLEKEIVKKRSILDIGSNIGAMLFEAQKYNPGKCLGIEYDKNKVQVASRIAAYNGLNNIVFQIGDIEKIHAEDIGRFDIVFCMAVLAHVKKPKRLFQLLSEVTVEFLYFEGNSSTDPKFIQSELVGCGFKKVTYFGSCSDDHLESNNNRPLFLAEK